MFQQSVGSDPMHCKVTLVTFLGTGFHENVGKFSELADITAESGVLRSFEWYTVLCMGGECDRSYFTVQLQMESNAIGLVITRVRDRRSVAFLLQKPEKTTT